MKTIFQKMIDADLDSAERVELIDYFLLKTLEIIKKKDRKEAIKLIERFEEFELILSPESFFAGFFFTLSHILSLAYGYGDDKKHIASLIDKYKDFKTTINHLGEIYKGG